MKQFTTIEKLDTSILYALELASSVSVLLLAFGLIASHGIRNEKQASNQRNEHHALLTYRQEEEKREWKKSKKQRRAVWPDKRDDPSETKGRKWAEEPSRREHSGRE